MAKGVYTTRSKELVRRETTSAYLFLLPSLVFFIGFVIIPMIICVYTSFFDSTMGKDAKDVFIGFGNYIELFRDGIFLKALKNTFVIVIISVPVVCIFSLWVSSVIYNLNDKVLSVFRCIFYLPVVTGSVAVTVVWKWMYNNYYGIFNYIGKSSGILKTNINWLGDERFALACIILILLTTSVGQPIVLYVSALGNAIILEDKVAADNAYHTLYTCNNHYKQFPMFRPDTALDIRRSESFNRYRNVLYLLYGI